MKKDIVEIVKVASLVVMAISLAVISWKMSTEVNEIKEALDLIAGRIDELKY